MIPHRYTVIWNGNMHGPFFNEASAHNWMKAHAPGIDGYCVMPTKELTGFDLTDLRFEFCDICCEPGGIGAEYGDIQLGRMDDSINGDEIAHAKCWRRDPECKCWTPLTPEDARRRYEPTSESEDA